MVGGVVDAIYTCYWHIIFRAFSSAAFGCQIFIHDRNWLSSGACKQETQIPLIPPKPWLLRQAKAGSGECLAWKKTELRSPSTGPWVTCRVVGRPVSIGCYLIFSHTPPPTRSQPNPTPTWRRGLPQSKLISFIILDEVVRVDSTPAGSMPFYSIIRCTPALTTNLTPISKTTGSWIRGRKSPNHSQRGKK